MSDKNRQPRVCLACSVFRPELTALADQGVIDYRIRYLSSSMHMVPGKLDRKMTQLVEGERQQGHQVVMVYGDCHPHMHELQQYEGVARTRGMHCGEIILGKQRYKQLLREQAFLLLPEWTMRWRELLVDLEGLGEENTREMFRERHAKFVYLDTSVLPIPMDELGACAAHFDLPYEIETVSLDHLRELINDAEEQLDRPK